VGSLSGEGRMAWWAEPRNRERSSGRGPEAPKFHGRISASFAVQQAW
jgi:hypothetical protein